MGIILKEFPKRKLQNYITEVGIMFPNHYEHASTTNTCSALYRLTLVTNYLCK